MTTVFAGEHVEITELIRRRRELGHDSHDEVWEGTYHVAPNAGTEHGQVVAEVLGVLRAHVRGRLQASSAFNLGTREDYRVPDAGWFSATPTGTYAGSAVAVLEVLSSDDETYAKFDFYAARGVQEILVAHPVERWVQCWSRDADGVWVQVADSAVFAVSVAELVAEIVWP